MPTDAPPGISLIVPCYNASAFIGEAIASALAQTVTPREIIVVDDGSTDGSGAIAAAFGPDVRVIRQENRGANTARNLGVANSRCALVALLDADDIWPIDSLACRLRTLDANPGDGFAYGAVEHFFSPELPAERRCEIALAPVRPARLASAMLFRRSALAAVGPFDEGLRSGEMIAWTARAQRLGIRGAETGELVLRRRIHASNMVLAKDMFRSDNLRALRAAIAQRRSAAVDATP